MSDRYTRLYTLQNGDYIHQEDNCPVFCCAGALLFDNQQNRVLGQLKFKNLSEQTINTVMVKIYAYDEDGNQLKGIESFSYANLDVNPGEIFGGNKAIVFKEINVRRIGVEILSVIFNDGETWVKSDITALAISNNSFPSVRQNIKPKHAMVKIAVRSIIVMLILISVGIGIYCVAHLLGKNDAVIAAENAIDAIGTITIDSLKSIENAEKLYGILTDNEKEKVKNRIILVDAREDYEALLQEKNEALKKEVYKDAKYVYEQLKIAANLCIDGMDDIYGAWYFGIYDADDVSSETLFVYYMYQKTSNLSISDISEAIDDLGYSLYTLTSEFSACTQVAIRAHQNKGTYIEISNAIKAAQEVLQKLTDQYSDYEYYPKLKEYYSKVLSYSEFFWSPTGSFSQLADTINDYENAIRTFESDISFLFDK